MTCDVLIYLFSKPSADELDDKRSCTSRRQHTEARDLSNIARPTEAAADADLVGTPVFDQRSLCIVVAVELAWSSALSVDFVEAARTNFIGEKRVGYKKKKVADSC